jgi:hypothetical protein
VLAALQGRSYLPPATHRPRSKRCALQAAGIRPDRRGDARARAAGDVYPDEGHGFLRPESRTSFNAISEAFLAAHLGGRCESFGHDLTGSSLEVREGAGGIAGLEDA